MKISMLIFLGLLSSHVFGMDRYCNGAPTVVHANGGGRVAITASVAATAFVGPEAAVCEYAVVGGASEVRDDARIYGIARVRDGAIVSGSAQIFGNVVLTPQLPSVITVSDEAQIFGNAKLLGGVTVRGTAKVHDNARVASNALIEEAASVYGNATITGNAQIKGNSKVHGRAHIGGDVVAIDGADVCEGRYFEADTVLNSTICTAPSGGILPTLSVVAGSYFSCSLYATGRIRCWGSGTGGKLGHGNTLNIGDDEAPASILFVNIGGSAIQIATGYEHTCVLLDTGYVRCWGANYNYQLGVNGTPIIIGDNEVPASVLPLMVGDQVTQIAAGQFHTCALLLSGNVRCWGKGDYGQRGYGNTQNQYILLSDVNVGGIVTQISAGGAHTCALLNTGNVRCWGHGADGKLGYGNINNIGDNELPFTAGDVDVGGTVIQIATGNSHTCALLDTGAVRCWGKGGLLGYGNTANIGDTETPSSAGDVDVGGVVTQITAGASHTCALLTSGEVRCWGDGADGKLGYGNTTYIGDNETPGMVGSVDVGASVIQVSAGFNHTCATLSNGKVKCWGGNSLGQLGMGNTVSIGDNEVPSSVGNTLNFTSN